MGLKLKKNSKDKLALDPKRLKRALEFAKTQPPVLVDPRQSLR
jgi:hypothetical protein